MDNTIVYSIRCTRLDTKKVILADDILAMPWIKIEEFSEYWLKSFGKEVERLSEDNSCEVTINCSTGESRKFTRVVNVEKSFKDITSSDPEPVVEEHPSSEPIQTQAAPEQVKDEPKQTSDEKVEEKKIEEPKKKPAAKKSESKKESKPKSKSKKSDAKPAEDK